MGVSRKEQLGERIRTLRKQASLRQEQVAEVIGIDAKSLSRIEQGKHYPSLETLEAISRAVGAPLREFFDFPDDQESLEVLRARLRELADTLPEAQLRDLLRAARDLV